MGHLEASWEFVWESTTALIFSLLLAVVGSIILLIVLNRLKLLKRESRLGKILSGFYYLYIPVAIIIYVFAFTVVSTMKRGVIEATDGTISIIEEAMYPTYESYMASSFDESYREINIPSTEMAVDEYFLKDADKDAFGFGFKRWLLIQLLDYSRAEMDKKSEEVVGFDTHDAETAAETDLFTGIYKGAFEVIRQESEAQIDRSFFSFKLLLWIGFLFVLWPFVEIFFGKRKDKKRLANS
ncbi:MAG: hypothetical protein MI810_12545 [Flavobacteriales bacterium]|nr:hypothetical protein [Flavobacteriales bacterium]